MRILQDVPLSQHSTMRLGGKAAYAADIINRQDLTEALAYASDRHLPVIMIGHGSNIVWKDEGFKGLLLVNKLAGYQLFKEDEENQYLIVGAGENWDSVVERTAKAGLSGIEALSLIPGTVGATPVQNVGAYGQEISQTLVSIEAYDTKTQQFINIPNEDCNFGYRTSRFKTEDRGRFFITAVTLHLMKGHMEPPFYTVLEEYMRNHNIQDHSPLAIRGAVIEIRNAKLPDPTQIANNGSFFANPLISSEKSLELIDKYTNIKHWPTQDGQVKISAAWLVENAGFKNFHDQETGMATWPMQSLVFINEHAKNTGDLLAFKQKIVTAVQQKFDITLEQEPELLP